MSTFIPSFITTVWNSSQSLCCLQIFQSENAECLDQWIEDSLYGTSARKYREAPGVCVAGLALPSQEFSVWSVGASWMQWYGFVIGQRHLVWWLFVYLYCIKKKTKKHQFIKCCMYFLLDIQWASWSHWNSVMHGDNAITTHHPCLFLSAALPPAVGPHSP